MNKVIKNGLLAYSLAIGVLIVSRAPSVFAADPYLGGPSIIGMHEKAVFNGGNFEANSAVWMVVIYPDQKQYSQNVAADADGSLSFQVPVNSAGNYTLEARDQQGQVLKSVFFAVSQ